jgi:hypothetical protein
VNGAVHVTHTTSTCPADPAPSADSCCFDGVLLLLTAAAAAAAAVRAPARGACAHDVGRCRLRPPLHRASGRGGDASQIMSHCALRIILQPCVHFTDIFSVYASQSAFQILVCIQVFEICISNIIPQFAARFAAHPHSCKEHFVFFCGSFQRTRERRREKEREGERERERGREREKDRRKKGREGVR